MPTTVDVVLPDGTIQRTVTPDPIPQPEPVVTIYNQYQYSQLLASLQATVDQTQTTITDTTKLIAIMQPVLTQVQQQNTNPTSPQIVASASAQIVGG